MITGVLARWNQRVRVRDVTTEAEVRMVSLLEGGHTPRKAGGL